MPRTARIKLENGIYHVMVKSLSEILLFRSDDDKEFFLKLFNKYQKAYMFKIYSYCLMNNHAHFIINSNGADISAFMHKINQCYAQYYNRKYDRHGHVFQDRFKSKMVDNERYLITLSAYIHNNPVDINEFRDRVEDYKYSSLAEFLGKKCQKFVEVDTGAILEHFNMDQETAGKIYKKFIDIRRDAKIDKDTKDVCGKVNENESVLNVEFKTGQYEYRSGRKLLTRDLNPKEIVGFIAGKMKTSDKEINFKYNHVASEFRAVCSIIMSSLCNMKHKDISAFFGNLTCSQISNLCSRGYTLLFDDKKYIELIPEFLESFSG